MALTDENILIIAMYVFTLGFLFALGLKKAPLFFILAGIVGIVLGIEIWNLTNVSMPNASSILATVFIGMSCLIIAYGFIAKSADVTKG